MVRLHFNSENQSNRDKQTVQCHLTLQQNSVGEFRRHQMWSNWKTRVFLEFLSQSKQLIFPETKTQQALEETLPSSRLMTSRVWLNLPSWLLSLTVPLAAHHILSETKEIKQTGIVSRSRWRFTTLLFIGYLCGILARRLTIKHRVRKGAQIDWSGASRLSLKITKHLKLPDFRSSKSSNL